MLWVIECSTLLIFFPTCVILNIPPFKGSQDQLTAQETEETAPITALLIYVELVKLKATTSQLELRH